ncbi:TrmB family transcriptional regulator sugar-binding domain-containing protein [Halegenticoccus soli]|uniref:TrmB family transcriptional regulator sugar-binding domain-containing protein n=1 Tax=Halegenticoccus soli TaxID=1985678 RepID=UPI000C6E8E67|nr:TrmB family transcriptional regulator sugar-binding domain-containing protein [Halegenticoccus soli]
MNDTALADLLRQFGLSGKAIDTYLTILEHGEAKASTIADAAGVSKRYVYSISETLEDRGFVSVNDHVVPTTIRANPPADVVGALSRDLETMQPALEARYSETEPADDRFEVIKSRVTVLKRIRSHIDDADDEVTLSIPNAHLGEVAEELEAAVDRGVLVLLVVTGVGPQSELDFDGIASVVRAWTEPMPTMLTVDRRVGLVAPTEMVVRTNSDARAILFSERRLGPVIVGSFLGNYWPMAEEVYATEAASLPRTYRNFRHAVLQATLHHRSETPLFVRVRGRRLPEGDPAELGGRLVDVRQGLLAPANNSFPVENSLVLETADGVVTVGGGGAFVEDFEADEVILDVTEEP